MADCLMDLVLRRGETDLPAVQAQLTLVAPVPTLVGADQPGEIRGEPVPAEVVRALARALGLIPDVPDDDVQAPASASAGPPAELLIEDDAEDAAGAEASERWWAEVDARAMRGEWGGEEEPPLEELERLWAREAASAGGPEYMDPTETLARAGSDGR